LAAFLTLSTAVHAVDKKTENATPSLLTLGHIDGEVDGNLTTMTIRLDKEPTWTKLSEVQDHGSFLQLILPGTLVPEPGKFFDGGNKIIPKIAAFQLTPSDAGIRLFVNKNAAKVKQAMMAETLGSRIILTIDNALLNGLMSENELRAEIVGPPAPRELTAEQVIAKTEVRHDEPAPSERLKAELKSKIVGSSGSSFDFSEKLTQVALFSAVMLILLLVSRFFKPFLRRRAASAGDFNPEPPVTIKTLASLNLASRQKVSLLQVGGEKILIGITPENVSFLTTIGASQNIATTTKAIGVMPTRAAQAAITGATQDFSTVLANSEDTIAMQPTPQPRRPAPKPPVVKSPPTDIPNTSVRTSVKPKASTANRINIAIDEDGIKNVAANRPTVKPPVSSNDNPAGQAAIDDVTRMIREKLKTLRSI
jgi:flagellar biogenesis protein FliO